MEGSLVRDDVADVLVRIQAILESPDYVQRVVGTRERWRIERVVSIRRQVRTGLLHDGSDGPAPVKPFVHVILLGPVRWSDMTLCGCLEQVWLVAQLPVEELASVQRLASVRDGVDKGLSCRRAVAA